MRYLMRMLSPRDRMRRADTLAVLGFTWIFAKGGYVGGCDDVLHDLKEQLHQCIAHTYNSQLLNWQGRFSAKSGVVVRRRKPRTEGRIAEGRKVGPKTRARIGARPGSDGAPTNIQQLGHDCLPPTPTPRACS